MAAIREGDFSLLAFALAGMVSLGSLLALFVFLPTLLLIPAQISVFGTSAVGFANPALPPFALRFGFAFIFAGAGYVLSTGDVENGSAITASWSGSYFIMNAIRREVNKLKGLPGSKPPVWPRHPLGLTLNGATLLIMTLYGGEYFWFQNFNRSEISE